MCPIEYKFSSCNLSNGLVAGGALISFTTVAERSVYIDKQGSCISIGWNLEFKTYVPDWTAYVYINWVVGIGSQLLKTQFCHSIVATFA